MLFLHSACLQSQYSGNWKPEEKHQPKMVALNLHYSQIQTVHAKSTPFNLYTTWFLMRHIVSIYEFTNLDVRLYEGERTNPNIPFTGTILFSG